LRIDSLHRISGLFLPPVMIAGAVVFGEFNRVIEYPGKYELLVTPSRIAYAGFPLTAKGITSLLLS